MSDDFINWMVSLVSKTVLCKEQVIILFSMTEKECFARFVTSKVIDIIGLLSQNDCFLPDDLFRLVKLPVFISKLSHEFVVELSDLKKRMSKQEIYDYVINEVIVDNCDVRLDDHEVLLNLNDTTNTWRKEFTELGIFLGLATGERKMIKKHLEKVKKNANFVIFNRSTRQWRLIEQG